MKKEGARIDEWLREIAPSDELRKWFSHDPSRWEEFRRRYMKELEERQDMVDRLKAESKKEKCIVIHMFSEHLYETLATLPVWRLVGGGQPLFGKTIALYGCSDRGVLRTLCLLGCALTISISGPPNNPDSCRSI